MARGKRAIPSRLTHVLALSLNLNRYAPPSLLFGILYVAYIGISPTKDGKSRVTP